MDKANNALLGMARLLRTVAEGKYVEAEAYRTQLSRKMLDMPRSANRSRILK